MDLLCDNIVEEILLRQPLKYLHRLGATARRYNALVLGHEFTARYWSSHGPHLSGVFLQTERLIRPWGDRPCFLTATGRQPSATESVFASDIAFLPHLPQKQKHYCTSEGMIFIVPSSAGLLLCSRDEVKQVHYYVCNPVTWQCVELPELPWPGYYTGLLSVSANGDGTIKTFQVVLVNRPSEWQQDGSCMCFDLKMFSSDTGQWRAMRLRTPMRGADVHFPPLLGQGGTACWIECPSKDRVIAYNSVYRSVHVLPLPTRVAEDACNWCLGERQGDSLRFAHFNFSLFEVWDLQTQGEHGMRWNLVHQIGLTELIEQNPEAANVYGRAIQGYINRNSLFNVIGFHPIDDIVYFDIEGTVAAYSIVHRTIKFQSPRQCFPSYLFPYVHPAHPVLIPEIKDSKPGMVGVGEQP